MADGITRGDVRLYQFAVPDKRRPVVVLTRESAIGYLSTVTIAPITSTIHGVPSEVVLDEEDGMKVRCAVNLHNVVTVAKALGEYGVIRGGWLAIVRLAKCGPWHRGGWDPIPERSGSDPQSATVDDARSKSVV